MYATVKCLAFTVALEVVNVLTDKFTSLNYSTQIFWLLHLSVVLPALATLM